MTIIVCVQCQQTAAYVHFTWPTSEGIQEADLCASDAKKLWDQFKHTPAFSGLQIRAVRDQGVVK